MSVEAEGQSWNERPREGSARTVMGDGREGMWKWWSCACSGDEEVRKEEEEVLGVGVRGDGGRQCVGDHGGGGGHRRSWVYYVNSTANNLASWERVGTAVTLYSHVGFAILTQTDQDHVLSTLYTEKGHFYPEILFTLSIDGELLRI
jgi:hypothetical protein